MKTDIGDVASGRASLDPLTAEGRFAKQLVACLHDGDESLNYSTLERLRAGRERALAVQKQADWAFVVQNGFAMTGSAGACVALAGGGGGPQGEGEHRSWLEGLGRRSPWVALLVLVFGLFAITHVQNEIRASEVAELDAALLTDALPPVAYADLGFARFLSLQASRGIDGDDE